jgi:predicted lipid-binding transport protein (Tim44 family)
MSVLDLIVVLAVGGFIVSRFFSHKLPKDLGKKSRPKRKTRVVDFPTAPAVEDAGNAESPVLAKIREVDRQFTTAAFLEGAKKAYLYYYEKWNTKDDEALANLVSPNLLNGLVEKLNILDKKKQRPLVDVKEIVAVDIVDARLSGQTAIVDVQFTAKQSENTADEKTGKVVGTRKNAKILKSVWTFARSLKSDDPNWEVEAITKPS